MNTWHFKSFIRWWETEQKRFHCGQFSDRDIAYSAWLAGITYYTEKLKKKKKNGMRMKNMPIVTSVLL